MKTKPQLSDDMKFQKNYTKEKTHVNIEVPKEYNYLFTPVNPECTTCTSLKIADRLHTNCRLCNDFSNYEYRR